MRTLLCGMMVALALTAALFFWRFGRRSGDRFFDLFATAFALLAVNSFILGLTPPDTEAAAAVYLLRLAAFLLIAVAIIRKNRE